MSKPALFLHIQKTAGTSIVKHVSGCYNHNIISHLDFWTLQPDQVARFGFISGHFGYDYASQFMEGRYSFTFLRDPVERVLSFYCYARKEAENYEYPVFQLAQTHSLEEFLVKSRSDMAIYPFIWNHQVWQLACGWGNTLKKSIRSFTPESMLEEAKCNLCEFDHVGFVESLDEDVQVIHEALQVKSPVRIPRENVGQREKSFFELPESVQSLLRETVHFDQILYEYAKSLRGAQ